MATTAPWRSVVSALAACIALYGLSAAAQDDERERGRPQPKGGAAKQCTKHHTETPYRNYGYDHIVVISNTCEHVEHCVIEASSVDGKQEVDVPANGERSVTVRIGSPAREFTAKVSCEKK